LITHGARVPDALQRETLLRRAGTQIATRRDSETWAPALQRITEVVLRCVRGTSAERD